MKIKLELGQVSCRLSRKEAQALAEEGAISETVTLPGGAGYSVAIGTAEGLPAPQFSFDPAAASFVFYITPDDAHLLAEKPMKTGVRGTFDQGEFAIEVDVKDFKPGKGKA